MVGFGVAEAFLAMNHDDGLVGEGEPGCREFCGRVGEHLLQFSSARARHGGSLAEFLSAVSITEKGCFHTADHLEGGQTGGANCRNLHGWRVMRVDPVGGCLLGSGGVNGIAEFL